MIFLDTGFIYALLRPSEFHHSAAANIYKNYWDIDSIKVINSVVLSEILNRSVKLNVFAEEIYDSLIEEVMIVYLSENDFKYALELNKYFGNSINYSDCTVLKTMMDLGINKIVSFDNDFDKVNWVQRIH